MLQPPDYLSGSLLDSLQFFNTCLYLGSPKLNTPVLHINGVLEGQIEWINPLLDVLAMFLLIQFSAHLATIATRSHPDSHELLALQDTLVFFFLQSYFLAPSLYCCRGLFRCNLPLLNFTRFHKVFPLRSLPLAVTIAIQFDATHKLHPMIQAITKHLKQYWSVCGYY